MSFDLAELKAAVATRGRVARVVVAEVRGSTPREVGASMLVWEGGQSGTIGGGTLELEAAQSAFERRGATRHALGPDMGQCCGGAVTLWTDVFEAPDLDALQGPVIARGPGDMPLSVKRVLAQARGQGCRPPSSFTDGWMVEPLAEPQRHLWIWGAGHVGRALVQVLSPLPDLAVTWIDTETERFPDDIPAGVTMLPAAQPARLMPHAPMDADHLIVTYSHALDLDLCHAALGHGFAFCGLIGSDTKWARFRKRLAALGHSDAQIQRICCPIGQKHLGKHPAAIAIGVAAQLIDGQKRNGDACRTSFLASRA
ncbi:xanthine dehydrogenase accessory protein XdhC [Pacificoceanicola onchidii]|uniref:xanthine dehydrogenase accessory protein XdhC n=1 Tax=Pacificoceanicola onchidii TaxID=2562685 RepID=UPI0010A61547|nr:xanthine dehydrogenase accessory protein XdhC [Pacificoceanicola onchidii]